MFMIRSTVSKSLSAVQTALITTIVTFSVSMQTSYAAEFKVDMIQLEPWAMTQGGDQTVGIVVDILKEYEKRSGDKLITSLTPYARVEKDLETGDCDFTLLAWSDTRAAYATKGAPVVPIKFGIRPIKGVEVHSYDDLKTLTMSVTRGLKVEPKFDSDTSLKKDIDLDYATGVKKVTAGRVKAVAGSLPAINYSIKKLDLEDKFGEAYVLKVVPLTVQFSKKSKLLDQESHVNAIFEGMIKDGTTVKIHDKWMKK